MLNLDWHFFPVFDRLDPATAYPSTYNFGLVATSLVIAVLAAFVAFSISGRIVAATTRRARYAWASAGAISMGGGIWSMHFVGMLAFSLPCGITYDPVGTVLSMIPGILASGIALTTISRPEEPGLSRRSASAVLMGAGIAAMHYSGMAAMRPEALLRYNPRLVAISIVVAVVLAFVSLSIRFRFRPPQSSGMAATIIAASVMGCAVAGMHYAAMQASIFFPLPGVPTHSTALSPTLLALLITIFTVLIAVSTLVATFAGRQNELALNLSAEISRRKRTEEDLRRSETYLAEGQRLSHTGSWAFNVATRQFIHSSEEHYRLFGFDPRAGMPVWEDWIRRLHPEDRERTVDAIEQRIRERRDFELDYRTAHSNGTIKYIHALGHPVFNSSGDLVEFVGTSIDITERERAEAALRASEERWRAVFEKAMVGIVTVGLDGRFATANASYQRITGYTEDELRNLTVLDITHEEDRDLIQLLPANPLEARSAPVNEFEKRYRRRDGQVVWAYVSSFVVPATETTPAFVAAIVVDITGRKLTEEALQQAQADLARVNRVMLLGEMTASIAHEINQPIAAVITNANAGLRWLGARPANLEEVHQALGRIVRDGNHAGEVIHRIRGLARKQLPARRDRSDLNEAIREAVALTQTEVQRHEVNLQMRLSADLPLVPGDRVQLQQVIINLVMNAVEAMDGQGYSPRELTISSGTGSSSDVFVEVQDTGPGLDPADLDRLFQSFYTTKPEGMGLGLAISRSIVEAHGGRLSAVANQPHGAVFRFTLPLDEPASEFLEAPH